MLLLGRKTAPERVAAFLTEMDRRLSATGVMTLPMTRRDIADYLGLTLETVSRALSQMRRAGVLHFVSKTQREIVIFDRQRLATFDMEA
jgi:CRP/FNR family nitrogen fixation transcriptional regulator